NPYLRTGSMEFARIAETKRSVQLRPAMRRKNASSTMSMRAKTTLNLGFKWECLEAVGLPAARRTCTPGIRCIPVVVIKGQGVCFARRRTRQRRHGNYSAGTRATAPVRRPFRVDAFSNARTQSTRAGIDHAIELVLQVAERAREFAIVL